MDRKDTWFISGPMSGLTDFGRKRFAEAEAFLRETDPSCGVLNPACLPVDLPDEVYMPIDLAMLREAGKILMLEGWEDANGCRLEWLYALKTGKPVFFEKDLRRMTQ